LGDFSGTIFTIENTLNYPINLQNILLENKDKIIELMDLDGSELYFMVEGIDGYIEIDPYSEEVPEELQKKALYKYFNDLLVNNVSILNTELDPQSKYLILIMKNSAGYFELIKVLELINGGNNSNIKFEITVNKDNSPHLYFNLPN